MAAILQLSIGSNDTEETMKLHKTILTAVVLAAVSVTAFAQPDMKIDVGADAVVFREEGSIQVWTPDADGVWAPVISLSADEVLAYEDAVPNENTVVASEGDISVELLSNGQWQVNNGPDLEGKVNVVVFETDFTYTHEYNWSVYGDVL